MRRSTFILIIQVGITLICSVALIIAQATCDVDVRDVISQVEGVCATINDNQVCYGNFEVTAIVQDNAPSQTFSAQGDLVNVAYIRSLYLSGLDLDTETWGIAQMRLVAQTASGNQDINLLLFGDVQVENTVEQTTTFDVVVGEFAVNVRNSPRSNSVILASVPSGNVIEAVGRLEDSSWIRVRLENGGVGWLSASLIAPVSEDDSIEDLSIQDNASPYFGPMQAFYFTDGGESQCGNFMTDGLLIQTPEGSARVTLLINEVSIELIPNQNGATALVTGNAVDGLTVSVIDGEAVVSSSGSSFYVGATQQTTIPLDENLSPTGAPSVPAGYDVEDMAGLAVLPIIRDDSLPIVSNNSAGNAASNGNANGQGNGNANANANGQGSGNANANGQGNGNANGQGSGNANGRANGNANGN